MNFIYIIFIYKIILIIYNLLIESFYKNKKKIYLFIYFIYN